MDSAAASLADEFLADLDSEDEFADQDDPQAVPSEVSAPVDAQGDEAMTDSTLEKETAFVARAEKLEDASKLLFDGRIVTLTAKIDAYRREADVSSATPATAMEKILAERQGGQERSQDNTSYSLIVECNSISVEIGEELARIHKLIQDLFGKRFYDLESLVVNPLDYIRVVQRLAPAERISQVELGDLLPGPSVMVIKMSASNSVNDAVRLSEEQLQRVMDACEGALRLDASKVAILAFVESQMSIVAPNLSALVGTNIAANLIGIAGGLLALSRLPASTVQVLGADRKTLEGFSTVATVNKHAGFIFDCDLIQQTAPSFRKKVVRVLAPKCSLAARLDTYSLDQSDAEGQSMREEILKKVEKWQERPPAKQIKALPAPDDKVRPTRGGKRMRKMKERYAVTEYRKHANRMSFGVAEETYGNTEQGFGMLGAANRVKLHVVRDKKLSKQLAHRQEQEQRKAQKRGIRSTVAGGVSGLASSLTMTPVQGMELIDPEAQAKRIKEANQKYFGKSGTFSRPDTQAPQ